MEKLRVAYLVRPTALLHWLDLHWEGVKMELLSQFDLY